MPIGVGYVPAPHSTHVHRLDVDGLRLSAETFVAICNFPFTHLGGASFSNIDLKPPSTLALQQLVTLAPIWDRCSPALRQLDVQAISRSLDPSYSFLPTPHFILPVHLEALSVTRFEDDWLIRSPHPFNSSGLRSLSITELIHSPNFVPALQAIETLDLAIDVDNPGMDLSWFPRLTLLRMPVLPTGSWPAVLITLATVVTANRILRIIIAGGQLYGKNDLIPNSLNSPCTTLTRLLWSSK
ncbi:hypothetical protein C8R44DRAFT_865148 [Mycena epipterygia]|nr:hypothetical protein C8R44DRAFT_865148 [Mycena epipterygia]